MSRKIDWDRVRREKPLRQKGSEPLSSERWESGGTPIRHDQEIREHEKNLLAALVTGTKKLEGICREQKLSTTQAARLDEQSIALGTLKRTIQQKQLFSATPEMLEAKTWIDLAQLFIELLGSGQTISSLGRRIDQAGARLMKSETFQICATSETEMAFLHRYFPLYLKLRPIKNKFGAAATVLNYLRWRFPQEKL